MYYLFTVRFAVSGGFIRSDAYPVFLKIYFKYTFFFFLKKMNPSVYFRMDVPFIKTTLKSMVF